jgi:hypothetical protein
MARENQGLQIALIVFVMLAIILGVTTYLFFRQYEEADIKATKNAADADKATKQALKSDEETAELRRLIGAAKTDKVDAITTTLFAEDMKKFGGSYPEDSRFYHPLLEKLAKTVDDKNTELDKAKAQIAKLEADFATREAGKQPQIDEFKKAADEASKDRDSERAKYKSERDRIAQQEIKLRADFENARKDSAASMLKIEQKFQDAIAQMQKLLRINKGLSDRQQELTAQKFEIPSGEVRWVNQHTGTAWINLGRADALQRQVTFGVYQADVSDLTTGGRKASVEVTQVLGDHLAEVRVFDDKLADPIMPGDKIYTPVWTAGEKRHFALAGFMDIRGNGKNDLQMVKDLITMNGGVIDCFLDEKGKKVGDMTVNTRYLVFGQAPSEKSQPAMTAGVTKMVNEAEKFGVQKIQLNDLIQRMGWKNPSPVVGFGRGANPKDFAAKPDETGQRTSTGNHTDSYEPRQPPARAPSSSYFKFKL